MVVSLQSSCKQRNRDARDRGGFHIRECALEHRQATHANDRVDLAGLNQRHHERGAFGDQHGIAQPLGFRLQILNRAESALLAEEPEFVERRGTPVLDAEALRQQQQTALERDGRQLFAPDFVAEQNADVVRVQRVDSGARDDLFGVDAQLVEDQGRSSDRAAPLPT